VITSEDVREELATIAPQRECDRRAELSALFHSAGSLHLRGAGDWALHLDLGSGASARRAFALLRDSGIRSEIRTYRRRAFDTATRYQLHVDGDDDALRVLVAAGVVDRWL
jgi:DNA-binding transcriptional regulator WhiA